MPTPLVGIAYRPYFDNVQWPYSSKLPHSKPSNSVNYLSPFCLQASVCKSRFQSLFRPVCRFARGAVALESCSLVVEQRRVGYAN